MSNFKITAVALGAALAVVAGAQANAATFADYSAFSNDANLAWTQSGDFASGTLATTGVGGVAKTYFSFLDPSLSALSNLGANFTLTATGSASDPAQTLFGQIVEPNLSGSFSFIYSGSAPLTVGSHTYTTGANLLSGTFSGAEIIGPAGGSTGSVQDAILSGGAITYSSDFLQFSSTGDKGLSLELTSVLPSLNAFGGDSLNDFSGVSTGSFAADISGGGGGGGVPEPATWTMLLVGFGAIGASLRRRSLAVG